MPPYKLTAINIGSFNLGEADRILTLFSAERGIVRAVAKGARKPGNTMTGRSELLNINQLLLSTGRSLDIITQAQTLETFPGLRKDLSKLAYALYYAELTLNFGAGLADESACYFDFLKTALQKQSGWEQSQQPSSANESQPEKLCLRFELGLLNMLGYKPELTLCVTCRNAVDDHSVSGFDHELGGVVCNRCRHISNNTTLVAEPDFRSTCELTPLVWKQLILACTEDPLVTGITASRYTPSSAAGSSLMAAHRLMQNYLEYRSGRPLRSLDLLKNLNTSKKLHSTG